MKTTIVATTLALLLPCTTLAQAKRDAEPALAALEASLASADLTLALVQAQEALNGVYAQEAIAALQASIARAELTIALAEASDTLNAVSDTTLLNGGIAGGADQWIAAVVSERPTLAPAVRDMALAAGYSEVVVAGAVITGLGEAPATASGK